MPANTLPSSSRCGTDFPTRRAMLVHQPKCENCVSLRRGFRWGPWRSWCGKEFPHRKEKYDHQRTCDLCSGLSRASQKRRGDRYLAKNPQAKKEYARKWYRSEQGFRYVLKDRFGITLEVYNEKLDQQKGVCAGCGCPPVIKTQNRGAFYIDHCHVTGNFRGLLCRGCNSALGLVKDSTKTLLNLVKYLEDVDK